MTAQGAAEEGTKRIEPGQVRLQVVFNNVPHVEGLKTSWGFACIIELENTTLLFDTGDNGEILLANMQSLGLDPEAVRSVVLSHNHWDHTGGLEDFLVRNPNVTVYVPASFPDGFRQAVAQMGARVEIVSGPQQIVDRIHSTGEMGGAIPEQSLVLDTKEGLVVVTGCAHPGVAGIAERAKEQLGMDLYLVMGGFHMKGWGEGQYPGDHPSSSSLGCSEDRPEPLHRRAGHSHVS